MTAMTVVIEFTIVDCPKCGGHFAITKQFEAARRKDGASFCCPSGHGMSYGDTEADTLRRERDRLKQATSRLEEEARIAWNEATSQRARAAKAEAETKRVKKRAHAALCPCCNRSFANVARHMATKHPEIVPITAAKR